MPGKQIVVALSLFSATCSPAAAIRRDDPNHYVGNGQQGAMDSLINSFGGGGQPPPPATTAEPQAKPMTEAEVANILRDRLRGFSLPKAPAQAGIKPGGGSQIDEIRKSVRGIFGGADSAAEAVPESKTDKIMRQVGDYLESHKEEQKPKTAAGQAVAEVTDILEEEFNKFVDPLVGEAPASGIEAIQQLKKLRGLLTKEKGEKALPSTEDDISNLKTDMDKVKAETARMVASLVNVTQHNSIVEMMRRQKRERQELRRKAIERRLLGGNPRALSDSAQPASLLEREAAADGKEEGEERDPAFASMRQKLLARIAAAKKEAEAELANATGLPPSQAAAALVSSDPSDEQEDGADAGEAPKSGALTRDGHILYKMMKAVGKGSNELGSEILKDVVHTLDNITEANAVHEKGGFLANPKEHIQAFSNKIKAWSEYFSKNIRSTAHTASQGFGAGSGFSVNGMENIMDQIKVQTKAPSAEEQ